MEARASPETVAAGFSRKGAEHATPVQALYSADDLSEQNIETEFLRLKEGSKVVRTQFGEERFAKLNAMADRMRAHFEADPGDVTDDSLAGRQLIYDMEEVLRDCFAANDNRG